MLKNAHKATVNLQLAFTAQCDPNRHNMNCSSCWINKKMKNVETPGEKGEKVQKGKVCDLDIVFHFWLKRYYNLLQCYQEHPPPC